MVFILDFSLKEYEKTNSNAKIRVFIEYLYKNYGGSSDGEDFNNEYFRKISVDELIDSLLYYIEKNKVTSKETARIYITYITEFFTKELDKYGINNNIFTDSSLNNKLMSEAREISSRLKSKESKDVASDEDYEMLNNGIEDFLKQLNINDIYKEIIDYKEKNIGNIKIYNRFISIIAIKLIMKFGLGNATTISFQFKDLDMESKIITANGFSLGLDEDLIKLFEMYLPIREYILHLYALEESKLFIKYNGEQYIRYYKNRKPVPDYGSFFFIMKDKLKKQSAELFGARRALEMIENGIDISTVSKISDISTDKCIELQKNSANEEDLNKKLHKFFHKDEITKEKIDIKEKRYLICPFCGREIEGISSKWILVQFEDMDKKYLACRMCMDRNGKIRI